MAKLTPAERAELEARLKADDDDDGPDPEFEYSEGDRSVRLPWSRRHALTEEFGFKGGPRKAADPKPGGDDGKGDGDKTVRFGRRTG